MKPVNPPAPQGPDEEIFALIETLHLTGQRLEQLTSGEVDTVADREGRTFLLRHVQEQLRHTEVAKQAAILNALPAHVALLSAGGSIISVNQGWRTFASENALPDPQFAVGVNYLDICDSARGDDAAEAQLAATGIRLVITGAAPGFSVEYPCHSPTQQRWFLMTATPLAGDPPQGVVVMHTDISQRKRSEAEMRTLSRAMEQSPTSIVITDRAGLIEYVNPYFERITGYTRVELVGKNPRIFQSGKTAPEVYEQLWAAISVGGEWHGEMCNRRKSGELFWEFSSISGIRSENGQIERYIAVKEDITELKKATDKIVYLNRVYAMLSGINTLIVRVRDRDELFRESCRIAVETGGFRMALIGVVDPGSSKIVPVASMGKDDDLLQAVTAMLSSTDDGPKSMLARAVRERKAVVANDSANDPRVLFNKRYLASGVRSIAVFPFTVIDEVVGVLVLYASELAFFRDEELQLFTQLTGDIAFAIDHIGKQERLDYLAYYDTLTGLANRSLFLDRVTQYLHSALTHGDKPAVILMDLERFKNINDTLGRPAGDALLRQVAEWLSRNAGDASLLARIGADHFAAVLPEISQEGDLTRLIEKTMADFLEHPFRVDDAMFRIAVKAGVAIFPEDGADAETLFRNAEVALKRAKAGGESFLFYTQAMTAAAAGKLTLENQLR